ncbi:hypothetical protein DPU24_25590 [Salmonella enterica subsp. enterica serovar Oranienburg]|nr:hypothetical protein [Salmonella enterica subsp. enterica serovar Oranienburg]
MADLPRMMSNKSIQKFRLTDGTCRKMGTQIRYENNRNRTQKRTSQNTRKSSNNAGLKGMQKCEKGYANCTNSGTKSAQNETPANAQF